MTQFAIPFISDRIPELYRPGQGEVKVLPPVPYVHHTEGPPHLSFAMRTAALGYWLENAYDFPPDAGIWEVAITPLVKALETPFGAINMALVGFATAMPAYKQLGNVWVARDARRQGIARGLVEAALNDFEITSIQGPVSADGRALAAAVCPHLPVETDDVMGDWARADGLVA
jgi:GNAT superfamily N-acetyltransferase